MKRKFNLKMPICIGMLIVAMATSLGCSKDNDQNLQKEPITQVKDFDKLLSFFAWSIQVPKNQIKFDKNTNEFYLPNTVAREKLERIQEEYEKANIYKVNFENK
jgi:hypothetical protein